MYGNFFNDPRTQGPAPERITVYDGDDDVEIELPSKWAVCPVCNGNGSHVNPAIDCDGISGAQFADDPDFADSYFRGDYDVTCNRCQGKRVVAVPDFDALTARERQLLDEQERIDRELAAETAAELRWGC